MSERIEQLEDALRDILDIVEGWTGPAPKRDATAYIRRVATEALEGPGRAKEAA